MIIGGVYCEEPLLLKMRNSAIMSYTFKLHIEKDSSTLALSDGEHIVASRTWPEERGSGRAILSALDEMLSDGDLAPEMVDNFIIDSSLPETYTSYRIGKAIAVAYGFAVRELRKEKKKEEAEPEKR